MRGTPQRAEDRHCLDESTARGRSCALHSSRCPRNTCITKRTAIPHPSQIDHDGFADLFCRIHLRDEQEPTLVARHAGSDARAYLTGPTLR